MYGIADNYAFAGRFLPTSYLQSSSIIFLPLLLLGIIGVLHIRNLFFAFLIYWGLTNFFIYSYVQEKVQWLVLNPLLPLVMISAAYLGELLPRLNIRSRAGTFTIIFLIATSLFFVHSSVQLNFVNYASTIEPMIQHRSPRRNFLSSLQRYSRYLHSTATSPQGYRLLMKIWKPSCSGMHAIIQMWNGGEYERQIRRPAHHSERF